MANQGFILGVLLIVFVLVAGCTEQSTHRSYTNTVYGFSLNPPGGWHSVENGSSDVAVRDSWFGSRLMKKKVVIV